MGRGFLPKRGPAKMVQIPLDGGGGGGKVVGVNQRFPF